MNKLNKRIRVVILIFVLVIFVLIGLNLGKFLVESDELEKSDVIVVFSGDNGPRTERAVELLKE